MLPNKQLTVPMPGMEPESVDIVCESECDSASGLAGPPTGRGKLAPYGANQRSNDMQRGGKIRMKSECETHVYATRR